MQTFWSHFQEKYAYNFEIQISCKYDRDLLSYLNALFFWLNNGIF